MKCVVLVKAALFALFGLSILYSLNHNFREMSMSVDIPHGEKKEICINNSSAFFDLWNNRFLHITSSDPNFALYSKKTIVVSILNNKRIADRLEKASDGKSYKANVRMYFSQCYVVENSSTTPDSIHIEAFTYRRFTYINVVLMTILVGSLLYGWRYLIKEVVFYGVSVVALFISGISLITYIPHLKENLPGMRVVLGSLTYSILFAFIGSIFVTALCSFFLRVMLNYYHFSLSKLHRVPHIVSFIGPLICKYQYWVIGVFVAIEVIVIPLSKSALPVAITCNSILAGILFYYGQPMGANLVSGVIVSVLVLCLVIIFFLSYNSMNKSREEEEVDNDKKQK